MFPLHLFLTGDRLNRALALEWFNNLLELERDKPWLGRSFDREYEEQPLIQQTRWAPTR